MSDYYEMLHSLGRIQASLDAVQRYQDEHTVLLHSLDQRLGRVETKSTMRGAISGGSVAVLISAFVELIKAKLDAGG